MYEHRTQPLLPRPLFVRRVLAHAAVAGALILTSWGLGILGYHFLGGLSCIDSLLDASMILGGMGQVNELTTVPGKLFASFYSLFAAIVFLATSTLLIAPIAHRLLHRLHLEEERPRGPAGP